MAYIGKTPSQAVRSRYFYTASGGETSLSGADDNGDTLIFADGNYVDVYLNGVLLVASSDYNVNTVNTIAGLTALTASDIVEIVVYDTFSVFGGVFQGDLSADTITTNSINLGSTTTVSSVLDEDTMTSDSATALATQQSIKAYVDSQIGSNNELSEILTNGNTTDGNDILFGDNDKAIFGAGSDLQIYHNGNNSFIEDAGTGNIIIKAQDLTLQAVNGENYLTAVQNGAVSLFYGDNAVKLATTATGVDVTGTVTAEALRVEGGNATVISASPTAVPKLTLQNSDGTRVSTLEVFGINTELSNSTGGNLRFRTNASELERMRISPDGDISFYEDTGTTAKFFWDASAESLGIGTDSPSYPLHVQGNRLYLTNAGNTELMTTNTNGNVTGGIQALSNQSVRVGSISNYNCEMVVNNAVKGTWSASGLDVSGTVTADGLELNGSNNALLAMRTTGDTDSQVMGTQYLNNSGAVTAQTFATGNSTSSSIFRIKAIGAIDLIGGDIGVTAAAPDLRVAADGNVGINTTSGNEKLNVHGAIGSSSASAAFGAGLERIIMDYTGSVARVGHVNGASGSAKPVTFLVAGAEKMRIDSSGNVGIGGSPSELLHIKNASGDAAVRIQGNTRTFNIQQNNYGLRFVDVDAGSAERMRLTAGGNLNVGKTADGIGTAGLALRGDVDIAQFTRSGGEPLELNRLSNDGPLIIFYKDSTSMGNIGVSTGGSGSRLYIGTAATGLDFEDGNDAIRPINASNGNARDNAIDLGRPDVRFDDIYATNGTIQTSDANEKQQIAALTDAEITAAKAISQLFKTFKWRDKVAAKGDAARTHTGVIAQDVEAAMTAAGLDAGNYAFFISGTWWETQTEVPAVEAVAEVLDDDGNVVTEAVEAVAAYTRIDTYQTAEEAPEGATERTRRGIRYPELLAFVGAATEQRLANIETRLTALETAE